MPISVAAFRVRSLRKDKSGSDLRLRLRSSSEEATGNPFAQAIPCPVEEIRRERTAVERLFG